MVSNPSTILDLAERFALMMAGLRHIVGAGFARDRAGLALALAVTAALGRRAARFAVLLARFRAGRLPVQRPRSDAAPKAAAPRELGAAPGAGAIVRLPCGRAWLLRRMDGFWLYRIGNVAQFIPQLSAIVDDAEVQALLAASPQAGRLLRPLWHMLSPDPMPPSLRLERRPRPARRAPATRRNRPGGAEPPRPHPSRGPAETPGGPSPLRARSRGERPRRRAAFQG